ncbi:MAG: LysM peptidoglycan-binding domain-containing protein [Desulfobacteraceae bacterium]|nr:LysM peptidoglycan-binding domain-containing protein [Desulfobacteraceae bacterium]MBC2719829.1 LysM peptidoglycan-binding domain-containing protein [Desulfobacteraceae bacterium]
MTSETACPVCGLSFIPSDKSQCPQCDSELTCFRVLDSFPDEPVRKNTGSRKQAILLIIASLVLGLISVMSAYQLYLLKQLENRILERKTSFINAGPDDGLKHFVIDQPGPRTNGAAGNKDILETKEDIKGQSGLIKPSEKVDIGTGLAEDSRFWTYWATEKDTLWDISQKHYGLGDYYPVLLEHNCHLGIYDIGDGIQIKILKNTAIARDIYKKITEKKGDSIYWYYTVAEGDTLRSVAGKFYKTKNMIKLITDLNQELDLMSGQRIKILLK